MSVSVCVHAWRGQEATLGVFTLDPIYFVLNMRSLTGLELTKWARLASQQAPEICLSLLWLWYCRSTRHYSQFLFYVGSGGKFRPSRLQGKASTLPSELSSQPPWKILWFEEPKCSTALNDSCFEWGAVFRSTPSHNKHNYQVEIQCRWWGCTLSQSKLWSDARVVTYGPCFYTCFYKSTFIGIQQPSLYCCSVCFCANPSWAQ